MLLRGETNFFVHSLRHYSLFIFDLFDINVVTKLKSKTASQVFSKNLRNQGIFDIKKILHNYCIIVFVCVFEI